MFENVAQRTAAILIVAACAGAPIAAQAPASAKIPITTASEEARKLYVDGRDLLERLRGTDGRRMSSRPLPGIRTSHWRTWASRTRRAPTASSSRRRRRRLRWLTR